MACPGCGMRNRKSSGHARLRIGKGRFIVACVTTVETGYDIYINFIKREYTSLASFLNYCQTNRDTYKITFFICNRVHVIFFL